MSSDTARDTLQELGFSSEGYFELKIKLSAAEFAKLSRVAERQGCGRVELLQHLLQLAAECIAEADRPRLVQS
jgi:hypothetical protein